MTKGPGTTIVKLDAIQRAYVEGRIDLSEFERRVAAFLAAERDDDGTTKGPDR